MHIPLFCPYEPKQGEIFVQTSPTTLSSNLTEVRFRVSVDVHFGTYISVSEKFLNIFRGRSI